MELSLRISLLLGMAFYFGCIYALLVKKRINLKYTLLWIFTGFVMLIFVIFPKTLTIFSTIVGIIDITNALFAILLLFVLIICMSLTAIVSKLRNQNKTLIQKYAVLEKRLKELENITQ